ncbi:MAG: family 43 glycosylhydrolase [Ferruginibacter sp.]|nr:family 43 glycosylhydrolase [Ferruginibacter sp.]
MFINPINPGDYSNVNTIRFDPDYYAISSTFQFSHGIVILHSQDLVNWQIKGHVANNITTISPKF